MKRNNFKKASIRFIAAMVTLMFLFIGGCQQEEFSDKDDIIPYLSISSDNPFKNSKDLEIISMAFHRISLIRENGLLKIKQSSASEINVSDGLYKLLEKAVNHTNKLAISKTLKLSSPRLRSGAEDDPDYSKSYANNDCVAHAIAACTSHSFNYIDEWIRSQPEFYVDGVFKGTLLDHFERVCKHFMIGDLVTIDDMGEFNTNAVIVFDKGGNDFHAVNSMLFDSEQESFSYYDYQNPDPNGNPSLGIGSYENIRYIYLKQ